MTRFYHFSNFGAHLGEIQMLEAEVSAEINGINEVSFKCDTILTERDRLLWSDGTLWHEHVFQQSEQVHGDEDYLSYIFRVSYQADLRLFSINRLNLTNSNPQNALTWILAGTNWGVGTVDNVGTASFEWEGTTVYSALTEICDAYNLEVEPVLTVSNNGSVVRKLNLKAAIGTDRAVRFDYAYNLSGVTKTIIDQDVYTACYGYGASNNNSKLSVYIEDASLLELWGVPDGNGGLLHAVGIYENTDCETTAQLRAETQAYLEAHSMPAISYTIEVSGEDMSQVELGDVVHVVDREFNPELRFIARVIALKKDLITHRVTEVTIGTVLSVVTDVTLRTFKMSQAASQAMSSTSTAMSNLQADYDAKIKEYDSKLTSYETKLTTQGTTLEDQQKKLDEQASTIADYGKKIDQMQAEIDALKAASNG